MCFILIISVIVIDNKFYFVLWATLSNKKLELCPADVDGVMKFLGHDCEGEEWHLFSNASNTIWKVFSLCRM